MVSCFFLPLYPLQEPGTQIPKPPLGDLVKGTLSQRGSSIWLRPPPQKKNTISSSDRSLFRTNKGKKRGKNKNTSPVVLNGKIAAASSPGAVHHAGQRRVEAGGARAFALHRVGDEGADGLTRPGRWECRVFFLCVSCLLCSCFFCLGGKGCKCRCVVLCVFSLFVVSVVFCSSYLLLLLLFFFLGGGG